MCGANQSAGRVLRSRRVAGGKSHRRGQEFLLGRRCANESPILHPIRCGRSAGRALRWRSLAGGESHRRGQGCLLGRRCANESPILHSFPADCSTLPPQFAPIPQVWMEKFFLDVRLCRNSYTLPKFLHCRGLSPTHSPTRHLETPTHR